MRYLLTIAFIFSQVLAFAQGIPEKPREKRLVNDFTGTILSAQEANTLERKLLNYEDTTSTQVSILIVESLNGYEVVDFAQQTAEKWGVGQEEKDNGIFIVVSINDRKAAIVTGYGMEGAITDAATYTIREDYMNPRFREDNFYKGLDDATTVIFKLASGEYTSDEVANGKGSGGRGFPFFTLFILFFFIIPALVGKRRGRSFGSRGIPWWAWLMMGSGGGNHNDKWDNFRGGGGSFGGGGGGGFGGFGGGSFGGGGSGGSW